MCRAAPPTAPGGHERGGSGPSMPPFSPPVNAAPCSSRPRVFLTPPRRLAPARGGCGDRGSFFGCEGPGLGRGGPGGLHRRTAAGAAGEICRHGHAGEPGLGCWGYGRGSPGLRAPRPCPCPQPAPRQPLPRRGGQRPGKAHALLQAGAQQQAAPQISSSPPRQPRPSGPGWDDCSGPKTQQKSRFSLLNCYFISQPPRSPFPTAGTLVGSPLGR